MIALLWNLALAHAQSSGPSTESATPIVEVGEAQAIRQMIEFQVEAFRRDDAAAAWKVVAPGLQRKFGTADAFLELVRSQYAPVYRPKSYVFRDIIEVYGGYGQWMEFTGPHGERVRALYLLEKQPDGTWRTSGCLLFEPEPDKPAV
ncbi:MAG: DUF4864 domain-containing protein [Myxococcota bacterium]